MPHQTLIPWAKKLTILAALIALVATIYAFGATTPQDALASAHVEYVPLDWSLKPAGIGPGERFRLIFLSSTKRNATSSDIETYNTFVQNPRPPATPTSRTTPRDSGSSAAPKPSTPATTPGPTPTAPECRSTGWAATRSPTSYTDFYDGSWDDEANDRNELGNDAHDTSQTGNYTWTGCSHDGTKSFSGGVVSTRRKTQSDGETQRIQQRPHRRHRFDT